MDDVVECVVLEDLIVCVRGRDISDVGECYTVFPRWMEIDDFLSFLCRSDGSDDMVISLDKA